MSEDAEEAFAAVADEVRLRILRALYDADGPVSFSDLHDRVGVEDSGRFNYHLGKLRDRFVERGDDGYDLTYAGVRLVGALHSGVYTEERTVDPTPVDGDCPDCGGALYASYADERGRVACEDCGMSVVSSGLPAGFVDGREDDLPAALDGYVRALGRQFTAGFCPACLGRTVGRLEEQDRGLRAIYECQRCEQVLRGDVEQVVVEHPAVVTFYRNHGRDVRARRLWEFEALTGEAVTEPDGEPRARVTVELDGDVLALDLDASLDVVAVDRD
jgi:DNA-directed RNA polymerase subunit M/transcription elongation factor TFIIS